MAGLSNIETRIAKRVVDVLLPEVRLQARFRNTRVHHPIHGLVPREYVPSLAALAVRRRLMPIERNLQRLVEVPGEPERRVRKLADAWGAKTRIAFTRENIRGYIGDIRRDIWAVPHRFTYHVQHVYQTVRGM